MVTLDEHALRLWLKMGARNLAELMLPQWTAQTGPASLLVSAAPDLAEVMRDDVKNSARCQPVAGLKMVIAEHADPVPCLMWDNCVLLDIWIPR